MEEMINKNILCAVNQRFTFWIQENNVLASDKAVQSLDTDGVLEVLDLQLWTTALFH